MSTEPELIRKFEPLLRFSTDRDGGPEQFFPLSAGDYVHVCGMRRRKVGWIKAPGETLLGDLAAVANPQDCYLVFAAAEPHVGANLEARAYWRLLDYGLEFANAAPENDFALETAVPDVTIPRSLVDSAEADELEMILEGETAVERQPVFPEEFDVLPAEEGELESMAAVLEWVRFPGLAPLPQVIRDHALQKYAPFREWDRRPPVYHYHVSQSRGFKVLQYWFLYAYNDWAAHGGHNDHEGDWEVIYVFLGPEDIPLHVAYSKHVSIPLLHGPQTAPWSQVEKVGGTHPVVYVGCGSHANYIEKGDHPYLLYVDRAWGDYLAIGPHGDQSWGEPTLLTNKRWNTHFSGAWGALVKRWLGRVLPNTEGPTGPAQKGDKWFDPAAWAGISSLPAAAADRETMMNEIILDERLKQPLTDPQFDALTVQLSDPDSAGGQARARQALETAVSEVLGQSAEGWVVAAVHESLPGAFDLLPPFGLAVAVSQAFDLQYALAAQPAVATAEALFETTLDNMPEVPDTLANFDSELEGLQPIDWFAQLSAPEQNPLWSSQFIRAQEIWAQTEGKGVTIGHPDSGYMVHPQLDDSRIRHDKERDFYDGDADARNPQDRGGNHGLSTASVIVSGHELIDGGRFVFGVAPKAELIPMRITKKGPPVFLFQSGPRRVRQAIYHAIDSGADVISMSLGGVGENSLHRAIQEAVEQNIIVLAAAGNGVPFVVWPARYAETIAVAACEISRRPWNLSSRGSAVDITAPGHNIWRAYVDENDQQTARPSSGTSYATATMGGVAALWLAFHGRDQLLQKYAGMGIKLNDVFRKMLADSADDPPIDHNGQFGAGIVNVKRLLEAPLPEAADFDSGLFEELEGLDFEQVEPAALDKVAAVFDTVPQNEVRERLSAVTEVPADELDAAMAGVEDELLFHLVTNPQMRWALAAGRPEEDELEGLAPPGLTAVPELSGKLRRRLVQS